MDKRGIGQLRIHIGGRAPTDGRQCASLGEDRARTYMQGGVLLADSLHHGGVHGQQARAVIQPRDDVVQPTPGRVPHLVDDLHSRGSRQQAGARA